MKAALSAALSLACTVCAFAQGTFQNLDFEQATIVRFADSTVNVVASEALPGWSAFSGATKLDQIRYNDLATIPQVGLYGSNFYVLDGDFTFWLSGAGSISQTAIVPADARSLRLLTFSGLPPAVTVAGQPVPLLLLSDVSGHAIYGGDVSAFAGQSAALTFAPSARGSFIDDIQFSPNAVPEPKSLPLAAAAALLAIASWRRRRRLRA